MINSIKLIIYLFCLCGVIACEKSTKNESQSIKPQDQVVASPLQKLQEFTTFPENTRMKCKYTGGTPIDKNYNQDYSLYKSLNNIIVYERINNTLNVISSDEGFDKLENGASFEKSEKTVISNSRIVYGTSFRNSTAIILFVINEENSVKQSIGVMLTTPYENGLFFNSMGECTLIN